MKRFHTHLSVRNISESTEFYTRLFGQQPSVRKDDYAKWMLQDPRVNFAISSRGHAIGLDHFGFQVDQAEEFDELRGRADAASAGTTLDQGKTTCCYSSSQKHWTVDPQGLAWEHFHTMSDALEFGHDSATSAAEGACCVPVATVTQGREDCCGPTPAKSSCCG